MGASTDDIDRQIKETRDQIDENLGTLEQRAVSSALHYGRIAAIVLGAAVITGASVLIYRRVNRRNRREKLRSMLAQALKDLPGSLHDGADELKTRLKKPLPSVKVVINGDEAAAQPGTLESIVRRVAPAVVSTASGAVIDRLGRSTERSAIPAYD
jgi:hypothetical protein